MQFSLLLTLAWRHVWRNYRRSLIMIAAITIGVWAMIWMTALLRGMVDQMVEDGIDTLLGHVQIHAPGYLDDPAIDHTLNRLPPALMEVLDSELVTGWSPRIRLPGVISSERESRAVTLVGIDPPREAPLSFIASAVTEGGYFESATDRGIILGEALAEELETRLGQRIVLMSQNRGNEVVDRGFRIVGIYQAKLKSTEKQYVFLTLATARKLVQLSTEASEIVVRLPDYRTTQPALQRLTEAAPELDVRDWNQLDSYLEAMLSMMDGMVMVWFVVVFLALSFGLVNTLVMAIFERIREIGLVQALGMKPRRIMIQILIESAFLLLIGLVLGTLLGWGTVKPLESGIDISSVSAGLEWAGMSSMLYPVLRLEDVLLANATVLVLGLLASVLPAWRAAHYAPMDALTRN